MAQQGVFAASCASRPEVHNFHVEQLSQEVPAFGESEWLPQVQCFKGNMSIPLISLNGEMNDSFNEPMKVTA